MDKVLAIDLLPFFFVEDKATFVAVLYKISNCDNFLVALKPSALTLY
jgi:hypothetical protein